MTDLIERTSHRFGEQLPGESRREIFDRIRALAPGFGGRAEAAEEAGGYPASRFRNSSTPASHEYLFRPVSEATGSASTRGSMSSRRSARPMPLMVGVPA